MLMTPAPVGVGLGSPPAQRKNSLAAPGVEKEKREITLT
jgi:hypothetical protein